MLFLKLSSFMNAGEAVDVEDEVVIVNSIVLPNKILNVSVQEEIIL
jgi:mannose-1-phosphate guanylyltransferase